MAVPLRADAVTIAPFAKPTIVLSMDARSKTAARVHEIAPFHVMEVQTAARALEAAGRSIIHMEIGEPDFPTPEPVLAAALAGIAGGPESNYQLTADLIAQYWTPRTRGALIASPSNPTGTTVPWEEMESIALAVAARGGALIVDEIYLGLSYAGQPRTALELSA